MTSNQEIDLFKIINKTFTSFFRFIKDNLLMMFFLTIIGAILGYFVSPVLKKYESRILVSPNYGTVDYLYNEIDLINSKIKDKDTVFLNSIGLTSPISKISIEPVNSVYQFVQESEKNYDLIKLFAEDGDINKVADDEKTSKNYRVHQINIITKKQTLNESNIDKLMHFLNENKHYNEVKKVLIKNNEARIISNGKTIEQINSVLAKFNTDVTDNKSPNLVYFNDNNQLNDLINTKNNLIKENESLILEKINSTNIIKKTSHFLNIQEESKTKLLVIVFPFLFLSIFLIIKMILKK
ncbi:hypothetical protein [Faecalibacter rhinopitheci]|uniref:Uncharacterized protein n=1 Tax=Faecalibacter rhinopitheci TaxID=2779678 RepID=A0A8J7FQC8_9FLAO|nr:hypothetical protein [Faecalibacter rhinopitheci]MBF0597704.1 hypothetical protein [Faecalibacter rhinopitheci]